MPVVTLGKQSWSLWGWLLLRAEAEPPFSSWFVLPCIFRALLSHLDVETVILAFNPTVSQTRHGLFSKTTMSLRHHRPNVCDHLCGQLP